MLPSGELSDELGVGSQELLLLLVTPPEPDRWSLPWALIAAAPLCGPNSGSLWVVSVCFADRENFGSLSRKHTSLQFRSSQFAGTFGFPGSFVSWKITSGSQLF